jgi:hypothetical protein
MEGATYWKIDDHLTIKTSIGRYTFYLNGRMPHDALVEESEELRAEIERRKHQLDAIRLYVEGIAKPSPDAMRV